jgi:Holliday junction DNA helicase RuvB
MVNLDLKSLIGNEPIKRQLAISLGASKLHNKAMGHLLFAGSAGCGKTSSAKALAAMSGAPFVEISAESIKTAEDLAKLFHKFPTSGYDSKTGEKVGKIQPAIIFVDEAHRLSLKTEEMLGIAMENFRHTFTVGRGRSKQTVTTWVPEFTLVCATTMEGKLSKPFRDRFKTRFIFNTYSFEESIQIVLIHAKKRCIPISQEAVIEIAKRGRGTPRKLVGFLESIHDSMVYLGKTEVTADLSKAQFTLMEIDAIGLNKTDIVVLKDLYETDLPKGLDSLSVKTNVDAKTLEEVHEPYLLSLGFIERSKSGRVITDAGAQHLVRFGHVEAPKEPELFARALTITEG